MTSRRAWRRPAAAAATSGISLRESGSTRRPEKLGRETVLDAVLFSFVGVAFLLHWVLADPGFEASDTQDDWRHVLGFSAALLSLAVALPMFALLVGKRGVVWVSLVAAAGAALSCAANIVEDGLHMGWAFFVFVLGTGALGLGLVALTAAIATAAHGNRTAHRAGSRRNAGRDPLLRPRGRPCHVRHLARGRRLRGRHDRPAYREAPRVDHARARPSERPRHRARRRAVGPARTATEPRPRPAARPASNGPGTGISPIAPPQRIGRGMRPSRTTASVARTKRRRRLPHGRVGSPMRVPLPFSAWFAARLPRVVDEPAFAKFQLPVAKGRGSAGRTRTYNPPVNSRMLCH